MIARGQSAHGARPWEGESASFKLIHALHELKESFKGHNIETDSLNIGKVQGGDGYNIVPSEMVAAVEIRYLNKDTLQEKRDLIHALCKKHDLVFQEYALCSSVLTDLNIPLVQTYLKSVEAITGKRPHSFTSCACSDAPAFYDEGITCILSCPTGGGHHSEREWINRESFLQFVPIMRDYLARVAKS